MVKIEEQLKETKSYIQYLLNEPEEKNYIYLFKSLEEAKQTSEFLKERDCASTRQIAFIDTTNQKMFFKEISILTKEYDNVAFVTDESNFTSDEISNYSLILDKPLYETWDKKCDSFPKENIFSKLVSIVNNDKNSILGKKIHLAYESSYNSQCDDYKQKIISYKNMLIKIWSETKGKSSKYSYSIHTYFNVLTNYSFIISKININVDEGKFQQQDLELKVTDYNGNIFTINIPAKDKYSLSNFRKKVYPEGNLVDFMSNSDFSQILNRIYQESNPEIVHIYNRPGLTADTNDWLWSDDIENLED